MGNTQATEAIHQHIAAGDVDALSKVLTRQRANGAEQPTSTVVRAWMCKAAILQHHHVLLALIQHFGEGSVDVEVASQAIQSSPTDSSHQVVDTAFAYLLSDTNLANMSKKTLYRVSGLLHTAIASRNYHALRLLLANCPPLDLETKQKKGPTPLARAAANNDIESMQFLIDTGADLAAENHKREGLLHVCILERAHDALQWLLHNHSHQLNLELRDKDKRTPLLLAEKSNNFEAFQILAQAGVHINSGDIGDSPLLKASKHDRIQFVRFLLQQPGVRLTATRKVASPLQTAAAEDSPDALKVLLDHGCDIEYQHGESKGTALCHAAAAGKTRTAQILLDAGANVHAFDARGRTSLMRAVSSGNVELVQMLLDHGADMDALDQHGKSVLRYISQSIPLPGAKSKHKHKSKARAESISMTDDGLALYRMLVERGANPADALFVNGSTHSKLLQVILLNDLHRALDVNAPSPAGDTPLTAACAQNNSNAATFLVFSGADPNQPDLNHITPIMATSDTDIRSMLYEHGAIPPTWSPRNHRYFASEFRAQVFTMLCINHFDFRYVPDTDDDFDDDLDDEQLGRRVHENLPHLSTSSTTTTSSSTSSSSSSSSNPTPQQLHSATSSNTLTPTRDHSDDESDADDGSDDSDNDSDDIDNDDDDNNSSDSSADDHDFEHTADTTIGFNLPMEVLELIFAHLADMEPQPWDTSAQRNRKLASLRQSVLHDLQSRGLVVAVRVLEQLIAENDDLRGTSKSKKAKKTDKASNKTQRARRKNERRLFEIAQQVNQRGAQAQRQQQTE